MVSFITSYLHAFLIRLALMRRISRLVGCPVVRLHTARKRNVLDVTIETQRGRQQLRITVEELDA